MLTLFLFPPGPGVPLATGRACAEDAPHARRTSGPVLDLGRAERREEDKGCADGSFDRTLAREGPVAEKAEDSIMVRHRAQRASDASHQGLGKGAEKQKALAGKGKNKKTEDDGESEGY